MGKFCQCLTEFSARGMIMAGCYSLTFLFCTVMTIKDGVLQYTKTWSL